MNGPEILIPIFGILLVMIPVTGLTLILTARFALKPMAETIARALRESRGEPAPEAAVQLRDLTEEVQRLSDHVARLEQAQEFERQLRAPQR